MKSCNENIYTDTDIDCDKVREEYRYIVEKLEIMSKAMENRLQKQENELLQTNDEHQRLKAKVEEESLNSDEMVQFEKTLKEQQNALLIQMANVVKKSKTFTKWMKDTMKAVNEARDKVIKQNEKVSQEIKDEKKDINEKFAALKEEHEKMKEKLPSYSKFKNIAEELRRQNKTIEEEKELLARMSQLNNFKSVNTMESEKN